MLKKLMLTAAAILLMFGTAANAQYYQDRYYDRKNAVLKDGTAYAETYWNDWFYMDCEREGESATLSFKGNSLTVTADSDKAEFNGESITLTNIPYMNGENVMLPVREIVELFGGYVHYEDETGDVVAECGRDIIKESGTLGDSYNNWSITMPEGFYHYSDSVDSSTVYFDNFNGVRIRITMTSGALDYIKPDSVKLEDYLYRRETAETDDENSEYQGYVIEGKVYSHPTEENRAMLNSIMDSFKPYFMEGAADISNINEDGTGWKYGNIAEGIAFDMPVSWDNAYGIEQLGTQDEFLKGYIFGGENVDATAHHPVFTKMLSQFIRGVTAEEFVNTFSKDAEYIASDIDPELEKTEIGGVEVYRLEYKQETLYEREKHSVFTVFDSGDTTHIFEFYITSFSGTDTQQWEQMLNENIEQVFSTLKLSEPEGRGNTHYFTSDTDTVEEIEINGFKFNVPKKLLAEHEEEGIALFHNGLNGGIYDILSLDAAAAIIISEPEWTNGDVIINEIKSSSDVQDFKDFGEVNIGGKTYKKCTFTMGYESEYGSIDGTMYSDGSKCVLAMIIFYSGANVDSQYVKDLMAVIDSVH